jgi:hypothetical protein
VYLETRQYTQCSVIYTLYLYNAARMVLYLYYAARMVLYLYYRTCTTVLVLRCADGGAPRTSGGWIGIAVGEFE